MDVTTLAGTQYDPVLEVLGRRCAAFEGLWNVAYPNQVGSPLGSHEQRFSSGFKSQLAMAIETSLSRGNVSAKEVSQAASLFLFRKCLPSSGGDPLGGYFEKLARERPLNGAFVEGSRLAMETLFPKGWDSGYSKYVDRAIITMGSCEEVPRRSGGAREYAASFGRETWKQALLGETERVLKSDPSTWTRKVVILEDGGKKRVITVAPGAQHLLHPLHDMIYDLLVDRRVAMRGDANAESLATMVRSCDQKDEIFVSGDYESATDNFNASHSTWLLEKLRSHSTCVPSAIWDIAIASLRGQLKDPREKDKIHVQSDGQMMGNYLSFPLLCLTNFLGVACSLGFSRAKQLSRDGLLKINGDDIVFRATRSEYERWAEGVKTAGLTLSKGKTLVHKRFFSINSAFFRSTSQKCVQVPVLRSKSLLLLEEHDIHTFEPRGLSGFGSFKGLRAFSGLCEWWMWRNRYLLEGAVGTEGGPWVTLRKLAPKLYSGVRVALEKVPWARKREAWIGKRVYDGVNTLPSKSLPERVMKSPPDEGILSVFPSWKRKRGNILEVVERIADHVYGNWMLERAWVRPSEEEESLRNDDGGQLMYRPKEVTIQEKNWRALLRGEFPYTSNALTKYQLKALPLGVFLDTTYEEADMKMPSSHLLDLQVEARLNRSSACVAVLNADRDRRGKVVQDMSAVCQFGGGGRVWEEKDWRGARPYKGGIGTQVCLPVNWDGRTGEDPVFHSAHF